MRGSYHENQGPQEFISRSQEKRIAIQKGQKMEPNLLTVYGILKRGYSLDLEREGCKFLGTVQVPNTNLYSIGEGVGLLREDGGLSFGELFEVPERLWRWLDGIEGHPYTYRRELITVWLEGEPQPDFSIEDGPAVESWIYVHQRPEYFSGKIESGRYEQGGHYARGRD